ncbi:X-Pro dipeptidyl-peptidase [Leucobacter sp. UCD-THU]|uniref:CocE/NonD family hydrolase n=1 Tax=Leucobacter sp. UCD-THU TaxID=1292023 RepID=UPI00036EA3AA|nr:CocE/NonD family hydrolase [Leucobacter sp. UCD-THU]EYT56119.1 X-Pro dipeptidyl-peptidase [Leucobacter sp. UCD-THU]
MTTQYHRLGPAPVSELAREERVRMRDGVRLATDVYLPRAGGSRSTDADRPEGAERPAPDAGAEQANLAQTGALDETPGDTILIRLPYDKSGEYTFIPLIAEYFTRHGYRVVAQDVRGKFRSEGEALLFVNEVRDGSDTLDWIVQQPWSNGRVAMWGDSYYGYTQWAAAASGHPALRAIAPRVTGTQLGEPVHRRPGDRTRPVEWAITNLYPLTHFHGPDTWLWEPDWSRRDFAAQAEAFMAHAGSRSRSYDQWAPHPVTLPRFPQGDPFAGRSVPALHTIGWWDNCAPLSWADVDAIREHPNWDALHYLRIEPIDHESFRLVERAADRVEQRSEAQIRALLPRTLDPALAFFEVFVRGNGSPADVPRVSWNLAASDEGDAGEMRIADAWPPAGVRVETRFATPRGGLAAERPAEAGEASWRHDPADPVPSSVPDAFSYLLHLPDEAPIGARGDVLVFEAPVQPCDVDLAGPVEARVRLRSSGPVADCFVRLLDVAPDGTALRIARGQLQLRDATRAETLAIDLGHVGYRLRAGHQLRVHVSSSDYPEFLPQPGTGADPWTEGERMRTNTQTIVIGGADALAIDIPVLEGALA